MEGVSILLHQVRYEVGTGTRLTQEVHLPWAAGPRTRCTRVVPRILRPSAPMTSPRLCPADLE